MGVSLLEGNRLGGACDREIGGVGGILLVSIRAGGSRTDRLRRLQEVVVLILISIVNGPTCWRY